MSESFTIQSHTGPYEVHFVDNGPKRASELTSPEVHFVVDRRVARLYASRLDAVLNAHSVLLIEADEYAKSLERMPSYIDHLLRHGFRRTHRFVAVGGGVTQDITCFLATTIMRGVEWRFFPTTLLAQADSCIGSKSSINVGEAKNILGSFKPPRQIFIDVNFLATLDECDVRSGVGEILKVHAIAGPHAFDRLARDYDRIFVDPWTMAKYVGDALQIKKPYIEEDEFDLGRRQVFNYGHSFGHAIESATDFKIPHGIAVTMGMDVANFVASRLAPATTPTFQRMHTVLRRNYRGFETLDVSFDKFLAALGRDKKNVGVGEITIVLPDEKGLPARVRRPADATFTKICREYFAGARLS